ncbi:MAG: DNA polymerase III [Candidatus Colwellbacteria bacterium RBG_13_48_8]|uniref:DNA polymerase beta n=1 Tax=Candidatus Colwellbacteria bacterium RBG_13_48_8 TaxID=1797685 RepID=A0A1G1YX22_9BACT|nr:MAG: DNA polymerase III [Candidatus Colwellbacteria bacterium RBG_13_48_8]
MKNAEIARIFSEISEYLEMQDIPFKPRAYQRVALAIEDLETEIADIYQSGGLKALKQIPGVGQAIAEKIEEILRTGRLKYYEQLKRATPVDLSALSKIESLGPKRVKALYERLKIKNVSELEKAARAGRIRNLSGFGEKSEENILRSISFYYSQSGRITLDKAIPIARSLENYLAGFPYVKKVIVAGSLRRFKETIGDLDVLVVSQNPRRVTEAFIKQPDVARVLARGDTKSSVTLKQGIDADLRIVTADSYGAALNYFTGSKAHNIALRRIAQSRGLKLNEYGLFRGKKQIAGATEAGLYEALGLAYIEPEMREDVGEIELARKHDLPKLIKYGTLQGDLQIQTNWTDGRDSIEAMARAAMKNGLKYIAITDHTKSLAMTGGLDERRLIQQGREIDKLNKKFKGKFKIFKGTECNILKDGSLDLDNRTLAKLDVVGAAVHSHFNLFQKQQTERIKKAMANPHVDIIFHPTGRLIGQRPPYEIGMDEIINFARATKTVLEIDGHPQRLDLRDDYIRKCATLGIKMSIDSDAHSTGAIAYLDVGIAQARRGWATKKDIINAWPADKMLQFLKPRR